MKRKTIWLISTVYIYIYVVCVYIYIYITIYKDTQPDVVVDFWLCPVSRWVKTHMYIYIYTPFVKYVLEHKCSHCHVSELHKSPFEFSALNKCRRVTVMFRRCTSAAL